MFIKAQLHFHTCMDPKDIFINYSPYQAIDKAVEYWYKFISFTHHQKFIFDKDWLKYWYSKWIILIPWIEYEIFKKHILIYNADESIHNVKTFEDLYEYKKRKKNIFIIAPHPFYPFKQCIWSYLDKYHYIIDWIEQSPLYLKKAWLKSNYLAKTFAEKYNKPFIGTSDVHNLKNINDTFSYINIDFDINKIIIDNNQYYINNFFTNIRNHKLYNVSKPFTFIKFIRHNLFFIKWRMIKPFIKLKYRLNKVYK